MLRSAAQNLMNCSAVISTHRGGSAQHHSAAGACAGYCCDTASHDAVWLDSRLSRSGTSATGTRTCKRFRLFKALPRIYRSSTPCRKAEHLGIAAVTVEAGLTCLVVSRSRIVTVCFSTVS